MVLGDDNAIQALTDTRFSILKNNLSMVSIVQYSIVQYCYHTLSSTLACFLQCFMLRFCWRCQQCVDLNYAASVQHFIYLTRFIDVRHTCRVGIFDTKFYEISLIACNYISFRNSLCIYHSQRHQQVKAGASSVSNHLEGIPAAIEYDIAVISQMVG